MTEREQLIADLLRDEGERFKPYVDSQGHLTIGVGHNLDHGISQKVSRIILEEDLDQAILDATVFPWFLTLDSARQRVIVNMVFNLGLAGLRKFVRTLASIEAGDYAAASRHMLDSQWARQVGARAKRLADLMERGSP